MRSLCSTPEASDLPYTLICDEPHSFHPTTANLMDHAGYTGRQVAARPGNSVETVMRRYYDQTSAPEGEADALDRAAFGASPAGKVDTAASDRYLSVTEAG